MAYWSRQLIKSEQNYSATEKEALAIVEAIEHFLVYLYGSDVLVCTEHQPLKWMMNVKDPQPRGARWIVRLLEHSFRIEYRPGKLNGNSDSLSRWPIENDEKVHEKNLDVDFNVIIFTDCQTDQQTEDKNIAQLIEWKNLRDIRPDVKGLTGDLRTLWLQWNRLTIINGVLYRSWKIDGDTVRYQYVVPIDKRSEILKHMHESEFGGHFSCVGTTGKIESKYYWPKVIKSTSEEMSKRSNDDVQPSTSKKASNDWNYNVSKMKHFVIDKASYELTLEQIKSLFKSIRIMALES
ncbi:unnamed protein product [Brachionus calyciflorus]|uniref:Reverse transcriptase RNase H-like domain-containing protein n=1 Tax=Brachionus calyciflorus TaxID=104777 RepID=A0A814BWZ8_9BILA|nr:unnamed protein product [Brachionus calyciflorus]